MCDFGVFLYVGVSAKISEHKIFGTPRLHSKKFRSAPASANTPLPATCQGRVVQKNFQLCVPEKILYLPRGPFSGTFFMSRGGSCAPLSCISNFNRPIGIYTCKTLFYAQLWVHRSCPSGGGKEENKPAHPASPRSIFKLVAWVAKFFLKATP